MFYNRFKNGAAPILTQPLNKSSPVVLHDCRQIRSHRSSPALLPRYLLFASLNFLVSISEKWRRAGVKDAISRIP